MSIPDNLCGQKVNIILLMYRTMYLPYSHGRSLTCNTSTGLIMAFQKTHNLS